MAVYEANDCIFIVNLKCGYSTFEKLRKMKKVHLFKGQKVGKKVYFISRDPYKRLESFYRDKIIKNMNANLNQYCQKSLLRFFPKERLIGLDISFEDFINAVGRGYYDCHICPLSKLIPIPIKEIIHLEDGLSQLEDIIGANPDKIKQNVTKNLHINTEWTPEMRKIVNKLYEMDFKKFKYEIK